jgi:hypothetical protein
MPKPEAKSTDRRHLQTLSDKATLRAGAKGRRRHIVPSPIVEVIVSPRCQHGCFWVQVDNTESVWRVEGQLEGELCAAGEMNTFHTHGFEPGDPQGEDCSCWDDD